MLDAISVSGTVAVSNLEASLRATENVPVRGIHIHAWIGGNATYNPDPSGQPANGLNGTGPGGVFADDYTNDSGHYGFGLDATPFAGEVIHIVAIAQSSGAGGSQYQVLQPIAGNAGPGYSLDPKNVYWVQFDDTVAAASIVTWGGVTFSWDLGHDKTLAAPDVDSKNHLPANANLALETALAFTAFSILETPYQFATTVMHAALAPQISLVIPVPTTVEAAAYGASMITYQNNDLEVPDHVSHEFGHLVAAKGGFMGGTADQNQHYAEANQRSQPPTTQTGSTPDGTVNASDLTIAWNEGFADYYAVASKTAVSTAGLNIPQLATDMQYPKYYVGSDVTPDDYVLAARPAREGPLGGWGEDNEISVMRVLWAYSHGSGNSHAGLYKKLTDIPLPTVFAPLTSLSGFWNVETAFATTEQAAAAGAIFQNSGVSPMSGDPSGKVPSTAQSVYFAVRDIYMVTNPGQPVLYDYVQALTFSTITVNVYNVWPDGGLSTDLLSISATISLSGGTYQFQNIAGGSGTFTQVGTWDDAAGYTEFQYALSAADQKAIRSTGKEDTVRYFVVTGSSTTSDSGHTVTGPYWSAPLKFGVQALAGTGNPVSATQGQAFTVQVATLTGIATSDESSICATVAWGDNTMSTIDNTSGTSAFGNISFSTDANGNIVATVNGTHDKLMPASMRSAPPSISTAKTSGRLIRRRPWPTPRPR